MSIAAIRVWSEMYMEERYKKDQKKLKKSDLVQDKVHHDIKSESEELNQTEDTVNSDEKLETGKLDKAEKQQKKRNEQVKELLKQANKYPEIDINDSRYEQYKFTVLEALSASGLRSIRYAKEIPGIKSIISNDLLASAVDSIQKNAVHNNVADIVQPNQGDACQVMYKAIGDKKSFHVVDLDPYGSAAPFLDGAIQTVAEGGLLCVTCTDLAVLAGSQPEACWMKYGGMNVPLAPYTHEMALRILLHAIQTSAAKYRISIEPLMSCSIDFYIRVFVRVRHSANLAKQASSKTSMIYTCQGCKSYMVQPIGKFIETKKGSKYGAATVTGSSSCDHCGYPTHIAGPFYSGYLHNEEFLARMSGHLAKNQHYGTWERMSGFVTMLSEELPNPFYHVLSRACAVLHCRSPPLMAFVSGLLSAGYKVSNSHACPQSIKTDAPTSVFWDVLRRWCEKNPPNVSETSPGHAILAKEAKTEVSFELHKDAEPRSAVLQMVRFQENPAPFWGPKVTILKSLKYRVDQEKKSRQKFQHQRKERDQMKK
ncbi:N2,N2-dimethylguanosine tRNA methyltransferase-domain-containing protein [Globomyces pollinis-pini]|nr:N2,N2-dimethylguanosine tRNA methyltransferase-domain-containing protein [Globomyces pollinis-pini]